MSSSAPIYLSVQMAITLLEGTCPFLGILTRGQFTAKCCSLNYLGISPLYTNSKNEVRCEVTPTLKTGRWKTIWICSTSFLVCQLTPTELSVLCCWNRWIPNKGIARYGLPNRFLSSFLNLSYLMSGSESHPPGRFVWYHKSRMNVSLCLLTFSLSRL